MSWGFRDHNNCVVSSVPNSKELTAPIDSKQRPLYPYRAYRISPIHKHNTDGRERGACGSITQPRQTHWMARM